MPPRKTELREEYFEWRFRPMRCVDEAYFDEEDVGEEPAPLLALDNKSDDNVEENKENKEYIADRMMLSTGGNDTVW